MYHMPVLNLFYVCFHSNRRNKINTNKTTGAMTSQTKDCDVFEVIQKYNREELLLNELLNEKQQHENLSENSTEEKQLLKITKEEAKKRNQELLKEFELTKARLRSEAIFCPTEIQWDEICKRYQQAPSLPVVTWRCHLPVFV